MQSVRLVRPVAQPGSNGPQNGQYALQRALRARSVPWLRIGGAPEAGEIAWFWCWLDREAAVAWAAQGRPFVLGPNVLFESSRQPCRVRAERILCGARSCRLLFTESEWYRELIESQRRAENRAPIVVWPYPIDPMPGGPLPAEHDLLIYAKSGFAAGLVERLQKSFRRSVVVRYGQFRREGLVEAARRSRACVYLSDDDRGPLALAEILLCGSPTVGIARGAPFVQPGRSGMLLDDFEPGRVIDAVEDCLELDREQVAATAREQFDPERIVDTVLGALAGVAAGPPI